MIVDAGNLKNAPLFRGLTQSDILWFFEATRAIQRDYAKGESVCKVGAVARDLGLVILGQVASKNFVQQGKHSRILRIYEPYDLLGLDTLYSRKKTFPRDIIAQRESSVLWIPFLEAKNIGKPDSKLRGVLTENMDMLIADDLIRADYKSEVLASNQVEQRLLVHLEMSAAKQDTREVEINMTQNELAEYLCVSRQALTKAISELRTQGKIRIDGKKIWLT
jgi:CRP-like cAMP-binding protein